VSARPPIPPGPYLIVGLARSGVAAASVLHARGEEVIGVDAGTPPGAHALVAQGVELHLHDDGLARLERAAAVVKSPPLPALAGCRCSGSWSWRGGCCPTTSSR